MPKQIDPAELDAIRKALATFPEGAQVPDIEGRLPFTIDRRTLQRRMELLVKEGLVRKEGIRRGTKYFAENVAAAKAAPAPVSGKDVALTLDVSPEGQEIFTAVTAPPQKRARVSYERAFLDSYRPNKTFYLNEDERSTLHAIGHSSQDAEPAGTYARQIFDRLLIDLSFNSSRLEGNTYSLLETKRLIELGRSAKDRDAQETQMIINHKAAIEFLMGAADESGINRRSILNLHAILSDNLLGDPAASGRLRRGPVEIGASVYTPTAVPQIIDECFTQIVNVATEIEDPFEQAFFMLVHFPYLQPFEDVNKRVSRLAANIPLIRHNLRPLSFIDVPKEDYVAGLLGVYELNKSALLKDVFIWAYERSASQYAAIRKSLGSPDEFRLQHREEIKNAVTEIVKSRVPPGDISRFISEWAAKNIEEEARTRFTSVVEAELAGLHEGNFARYPIKPSEFDAWIALDS